MKIEKIPNSEGYWWCKSLNIPIKVVEQGNELFYWTGSTYNKVFENEWVKLENPFYV